MAKGEGAGAGSKEQIGSAVWSGVPREVQVAADGGGAAVTVIAEPAGAFVQSKRKEGGENNKQKQRTKGNGGSMNTKPRRLNPLLNS